MSRLRRYIYRTAFAATRTQAACRRKIVATGEHHDCEISQPQKRWFMFSLTGGSWVLYHCIKSSVQDVKGEKTGGTRGKTEQELRVGSECGHRSGLPTPSEAHHYIQ